MKACPHCGCQISVGVMCADCADAISTDQLFDRVWPVIAFGFPICVVMLGVMLIALALALP